MKKAMLWGALLLACSGCIYAQEPTAAVTAGFSYINSKEGAPGHADIRGAYIQPAINLGSGLSFFGDLAFHHGEDRYGSFSLQSYTAGLAKRITGTPFSAFGWSGEVGGTRVSYHQGSGGAPFGSNRVQNGLTFMTSPVIAISLNPQVALSMVPAGLVIRGHAVDPYTSDNQSGRVRAGYYAKIGITVFFGGRGPYGRRY